jgi:hypothetical protein
MEISICTLLSFPSLLPNGFLYPGPMAWAIKKASCGKHN